MFAWTMSAFIQAKNVNQFKTNTLIFIERGAPGQAPRRQQICESSENGMVPCNNSATIFDSHAVGNQLVETLGVLGH
jgi:hypothetical protein